MPRVTATNKYVMITAETKRIVAIGCSMTYGHGLKDCFLPPAMPGLQPSNLAWPQLLSHALGLDITNLSEPGSSNKRIWHRATTYDFQPGDAAVIMWTYNTRSCVFHSNQECLNILPPDSSSSKIDLNYYKHFYNEYDAVIMDRLFVEHSDFILKSHGTPVIHLAVSRRNSSEIFARVDHIPEYFGDAKYSQSRALDHRHPGHGSHRKFAKVLAARITALM